MKRKVNDVPDHWTACTTSAAAPALPDHRPLPPPPRLQFTPPVLGGGPGAVRRPFKLPSLAPLPPALDPLPLQAESNDQQESEPAGATAASCTHDEPQHVALSAARPPKLPGLRAKKKAEPAGALPAVGSPAPTSPPAPAPAVAPAAPVAPAPTKGWVVRRLPVEPLPSPAPLAGPLMPPARQLLSCLPRLLVPAGGLTPLDHCCLGDLGAAAAALEAAMLPQPVAPPFCSLAPLAALGSQQVCGCDGVGGAADQRWWRAAPGAQVGAAHLRPQLTPHRTRLPWLQVLQATLAAFPVPQSGAGPRVMLGRVGAVAEPAAVPKQAAAEPAAVPKQAVPAPVPAAPQAAAAPARLLQQQAQAPRQAPSAAQAPLDEAAVRRQLGEAAPLSLSYLRSLVFAA